MVEALLVSAVERQRLVMSLAVVPSLPDATQPRDSQRTQPQHIGRAHVVDVGRNPAAIVQLSQVGGGLVVASDEDGQVGGLASAAVVLVKIAEGAVLGGHGHDLDVVAVADGLKVAANDDEVDAGPIASGAGLFDGVVDWVESAMALRGPSPVSICRVGDVYQGWTYAAFNGNSYATHLVGRLFGLCGEKGTRAKRSCCVSTVKRDNLLEETPFGNDVAIEHPIVDGNAGSLIQ